MPYKTQQNQITNKFNISTLFQYQNKSFSNNSVEHKYTVWPIDRTLSSATSPGQSWPRSEINEEEFRFPQSSSITEISLSEPLVLNSRTLFGGSYPSIESQSEYFYSPSWLGKSEKEIFEQVH